MAEYKIISYEGAVSSHFDFNNQGIYKDRFNRIIQRIEGTKYVILLDMNTELEHDANKGYYHGTYQPLEKKIIETLKEKTIINRTEISGRFC